MSQRSRTYNSIFNSLVGIISAVLTVVLNFAVRIVIVRTLGEEINGLHSLFQNIINMMAVVETSMCTAMIIHLYEPIKHDDVEELSRILSLYRKIYVVLSIGFLAVGGVLNLFLDLLITTNIPMSHAHFYFFLFTLSIAAGYLTYTHRIVLFAAQKNRISSIATLIAEIVFRGGAAITAVFFGNYTIFLLCYIGEKLFGNLVCRLYVRKTYKNVCCHVKDEHSKELRAKIMTTVKPLFVSRVADIVQNSSQSILISLLLGNIAIVGYYGNYALVVGSVGLLFSQFGAAFTSSFGNLATERDADRMYLAFRKTEFILTSIAIVICSGFLACIQDFISLAFGEQFLLGDSVMLILTATMFVSLLNIPCISVQNATGIHGVDVKNMILQAVCAVIGGYLGGFWFGMEGLLLGMLLPMVVFTTVLKSVIVQRRLFGKNTREALSVLLISLVKGVVTFALTFVIVSLIDTGALLLNILVKGIVTILVSVAALVLLSIRNPHFKSTMELVARFVRPAGGGRR